VRGHQQAGADRYVPDHGDTTYKVSRYDLDITYKVRGNHLTGVATLTVVALQDLRTFKLDLHGLRVRKVTVDGRAAKYTTKRDGLHVSPGPGVRRGQALMVTVHYSGSPRPVHVKHLGSAGWEELADGVIVAGQPHGAPSWFPCNDRPSDKARYRIRVTAPTEYRVVANGSLVSQRRRASATTWEYEQPEPMAPYLATVQIGRYTLREVDAQVPMYAAVPAHVVHGYHEAFGHQPDMLAAFTKLFGEYPFQRYTVVVTEDDLEIPLESQGLSTFGANHLRTDWDAERLVAHELAHQWFGNSLTVGAWHDIWLHEGFACYAEWLWSEESGERTAQQQAVKHWHRLDELDQDLLLGDPGPELMFDDRVYKRGALLLHALRLTVGDDKFFKTLRSWARTHAYSTVSTQAFIDHAEAQTGRALGDLFHAWLSKPALPELPRAR
jgi:aminopeptidase N